MSQSTCPHFRTRRTRVGDGWLRGSAGCCGRQRDVHGRVRHRYVAAAGFAALLYAVVTGDSISAP